MSLAVFNDSGTAIEINSISAVVTLPKKMKEMIALFQLRKGEVFSDKFQLICDRETGSNFYGIHRDDQMTDVESTAKRYEEMKSHLLKEMELQPDTLINQVVGDSAAFSPLGTEKAMQFLGSHLSRREAVLYGYTGHAEADGTRCVNAAVSDYVVERGLVKQTIGNLVGFHTPAALESWGCTGPQLSHYIVVYGNDDSKRETGAVFGDDITTSDFLSDRLIMLEGGIQSFRQACNFLLLKRPIVALADLRGDKTCFAKMADGSTKNYFSAPEFLQFIKEGVQGCKQAITDELLEDWYNGYLGARLISDPKRQDYDTKKKLLDDAWALFKAEKLYERLDLFAGKGAKQLYQIPKL